MTAPLAARLHAVFETRSPCGERWRRRRSWHGRLASGLLRAISSSGLLAFGCTAAQERIELAQQRHAAGDFLGAWHTLSDPSVAHLREETRDQLLWLMEEGKSAQDAGQFPESRATLAEASALADRFDDEFDATSLGEELGTIVVNPRLRVFRGSFTDRLQIENGRIVSAILAGDPLAASIAARRAIERQRDVEVDEGKRIAAADKEVAKRGGSKVVEAILEGQGIDMTAGAAPLLNPMSSWLSGLLQLSTGDGNDRQRGETDLKRALAMVPDNTVLQQEVKRAPVDLARSGQPQVIVLFEVGSGPTLEQITIPLVTPWLGLSTIPLPAMRFPPLPAEALEVTADGHAARTQMLVDLQAMWKQEFDRQLPETILRIALMVAAKEAATYAASEPFRRQSRSGRSSGDIGQILVLAAASLYKAATNQVDLRTWRSIPAQVQIAQVPRPASGVVTIGLVQSGSVVSPADIRLPDAPVALVWVRCVVPGAVVACAAALEGSPAIPSLGPSLHGAETAPADTTTSP